MRLKAAFYFFLSSHSLLLPLSFFLFCFFLFPLFIFLTRSYSISTSTWNHSTWICARPLLPPNLDAGHKESFPFEASGECKRRALLDVKVARVEFPVSVCQCRVTQQKSWSPAWMSPAEWGPSSADIRSKVGLCLAWSKLFCANDPWTNNHRTEIENKTRSVEWQLNIVTIVLHLTSYFTRAFLQDLIEKDIRERYISLITIFRRIFQNQYFIKILITKRNASFCE